MLFSSFFGFCICSLLAYLAICLAHHVLHFDFSKYIQLSLNLSIVLTASHNFDLLYLILLKCLIFSIVLEIGHYIRFLNFWSSKDTIMGVKMQNTKQEKTCVIHMFNKKVVFRIY